MYHFRFTLSAVLFSLLLATGSARADTFSTGNFYSGDQNNFSTGLISFSLDGASEVGAAGNIAGTTGVVDGKAVTFSQVFCVDIPDDIYLDSTYSATYSATGLIDGGTIANAGQIAWLIVNLAPLDTDTAENEGLQAAIWQVLYGSNFVMGTNSQAVDAAFTADMAAVAGQTAPVSSVYWVSPHNGNGSDAQAQVALALTPASNPAIIMGVNPAATPEPNSLLLLGTGLSAVGGVLRMRRRKLAA